MLFLQTNKDPLKKPKVKKEKTLKPGTQRVRVGALAATDPREGAGEGKGGRRERGEGGREGRGGERRREEGRREERRGEEEKGRRAR